MAYLTLRKLYYGDEAEYKQAYEERLNSPLTTKIDFMIGKRQAFFFRSREVMNATYSILRLDKEILSLRHSLPGKAEEQYSKKCLIDEIVITNNIEGVYSSRKEIGDALSILEEQSEKKGKAVRFLGMVNKYLKLLGGEPVDLKTCEDIRKIYDELVLDEVIIENAKNAPDGKLFRKDQAAVHSSTDKIIHRGVTPESRIIETMDLALAFLYDEEIEKLYRICLFHYLLEYIHPFYDGNGRLGRFILSYCISEELCPLLAFRLSETIKENIRNYYDAFRVCNDPHNLGDVTPFLIMMLEMIEEAATELRDSLKRKSISLTKYQSAVLRLKLAEDSKMSLLYSLLIQAALFSELGISTKDLMKTTETSYATVRKRLKLVEAKGLLLSTKDGREKYYELDIQALDNLIMPN